MTKPDPNAGPPCSIKQPSTVEAEEKRRAKRKELFLAELAKRGVVLHACRAAAISKTIAYEWKSNDEDFANAWIEAMDDAIDSMEDEAFRRGVEGVDRPVYQRGEVVGYIREYSDSLLQTLLKGNRPEKYKDRGFLEVTGKNGGAIEVKKLSDEELLTEAATILKRQVDTS